MNKLRCFIFDFGNVIYFFDHHKACHQLAALTSNRISEKEVYSSIFDSGLEMQYDMGKLSTEEFILAIRRKFGVSATAEEIGIAWSDIFWPNPPVIDLISRLKVNNFYLVLASNTNELHSRWFRTKFTSILTQFDNLILSHEVGVRKPDAIFYERCIASCGYQPQQCLYFDDNQSFVEAARNLGIEAIRYDAEKVDLYHTLQSFGVIIK